MSSILKVIALITLTACGPQSLCFAEQSQTMAEVWAAQLNTEDWPDEVKTLNPLAIYTDRANLVIATKRTGQKEEGYYIYIPISSYLPADDTEWTFTSAGNGLWRYTRKRSDIDWKKDISLPQYRDIQTEWIIVDKSELERENSNSNPLLGPVDPFAPPTPPRVNDWIVALFNDASAVPYDWMVDIVDGAVVTYDREHYILASVLARRAQPDQPEAPLSPTPDIPIYYDIASKATLWRQDLLEVSNGSIIAYGAGEFGAEVYWYNHNATEKKLISEHDIRSFFEINGRFYGYGGLTHGFSSEGYIVEFILENDAWSAVETYQSNEEIIAHCHLPNSDIVIATGTQIIRISGDGAYNILISDKRWARNSIHSMVAAPDGYIYFSMNHFIGRFPIRKTLGDYELLELAKN